MKKENNTEFTIPPDMAKALYRGAILIRRDQLLQQVQASYPRLRGEISDGFYLPSRGSLSQKPQDHRRQLSLYRKALIVMRRFLLRAEVKSLCVVVGFFAAIRSFLVFILPNKVDMPSRTKLD